MFEKLENLGLDYKNKSALLENFMQFFIDYSRKINLISRNDIEFFFEKHIYDSLSFNLFKEKYNIKSGRLLDIGSGGGFPAVPLALFFDNIDITAADSIGKKINFLKETAEKLGLKNLHPVCKRAEELPFKAEFDLGSCRAVSELRVILEYALPYLKTCGFFAAYKSLKAEEEIKNAQNALKVLKAEIIDKIEYTLPLDETHKRVLIIVRKNAETPEIYPRKNGIIPKKPL